MNYMRSTEAHVDNCPFKRGPRWGAKLIRGRRMLLQALADNRGQLQSSKGPLQDLSLHKEEHILQSHAK